MGLLQNIAESSTSVPSQILEVDFRRSIRAFLSFEVWICLELEPVGNQVGRKTVSRGVIVPCCFVESRSGDSNTIFRTGDLVHQTNKRFVRLEIRVLLNNDHQP